MLGHYKPYNDCHRQWVHWYYPSTLNVSPLHCVSLMGKVKTTEYLSNLPPTWAGVASGIEVKVCFSPLGGAVEVPLHFKNLRLGEI